MKKIFYEKVGKRYIPVAEYDSELLDSLPKGTHLIIVTPKSVSRRYNVAPEYAAMIAAGIAAEDKISRLLVEASAARPERQPLTPEQIAAWNHLSEVMGEERFLLTYASAREISRLGVEAMRTEAETLLKNPTVKKAWDHFMLTAALTKESDNTSSQ